jgi:hypothetical protein
MFDEYFLLTMTEVEREVWIAFRPWLRYYCCKYAREIRNLGVLNELKNHFLNTHLNFFHKILVQLVRSKENVSTNTLRKWKEDTGVGGMLTWCVTAAGRYIAKFQKLHIRGRATYAASPEREKDSTGPFNKISLVINAL